MTRFQILLIIICLFSIIILLGYWKGFEESYSRVIKIDTKNVENFTSIKLNEQNINKEAQRLVYEKSLSDYLKKWKISLDEGHSPLKTYFSLLDDTHKLMVLEQWLPQFDDIEPPTELSKELDCSNSVYSSFLEGSKRSNASNIIDLVLFGYELIMLEIRLYELYDTVDEFIIFEVSSTFKKLPKPYFFLENINRFKKFLDKITLVTRSNITRFNNHGTIKSKIEFDPVGGNEVISNKNSINENEYYKIDFEIERKFRMEPIQLYQKYVRKFDSNDVFIHGDVDEIPDRKIIYHFKHCNVKNLYPFSIWSTFYVFSLNTLFRGDFPSLSDPYSHKFPNIVVYETIVKHNFVRLTKTNMLPQGSGFHLNRLWKTFVYTMYKGMSQSDGGGVSKNYLDVFKNGSIEPYYEYNKKRSDGRIQNPWGDRLVNVKNFGEKHRIFVPWLVLKNKNIYKSFYSSF